MPAAGLLDVLTPSSQLAERQALGTSTERGLFPAMAKQESVLNIAKAAKEMALANKYNLNAPAERALLLSKIEKMLADSGLSDVKAEQIFSYIEPDVAGKWELAHQRHEQADYYAAKARAEDARAKFRAAGRGGAGRDDMFKWGKEWNDLAEAQVRESQKVVQEAIDSTEKASLKAQESAQHARRLSEEVGEKPTPPKGLEKTNPKLTEQYNESLRKWNERSDAAAAARRAADYDNTVVNAKNTKLEELQGQMHEAINAGNEARAEFRTLYEERRGLPVGTPPRAPARRKATPIMQEPPTAAPKAPAASFKEGQVVTRSINGQNVELVLRGGKWVRNK
jgi:hypothetical protein